MVAIPHANTAAGLSYGKEAADTTPEEAKNYVRDEAEIKLARKIDLLFDKYKKARSEYDFEWMDNYKFFRGRQWLEPRPAYRNAEVINIVWQTIQSQVPILTDSRPKFEFIPENPQDMQFAEIMNELAEADWQGKCWLSVLTEMLYDAKIYGTAISTLAWDQEENLGRGDLCYESAELFYCYPDPQARNINDRKSRGFIHAEPMTLEDIRRKWKKGKLVTADTIDLLKETKVDLNPLRFRSARGDRQSYEATRFGTFEDQPESKALVITAYYHCDEMDEIERMVEGGDGVEKRIYQLKLRYPKGRKTVVANGIVLEDGPNPNEDGKIPYCKLINYTLPREFWGENEINQLKGPQRAFNKIISYALDVLVLTGNPIWIVDTTSKVDTDKLNNAPGLVVEKSPGSEVRREAGVQLQPYVLQLMDRLKDYVETLSGSQDITRGIPAGGVTAASAIADLQNAAQTRMRQQSRNIDAYLQEFGQQYLSQVLQHYTVDRVFSYVGTDDVRKYFRAVIKKSENNQRILEVQRYDEFNQPIPQVDEIVINGSLKVRVTTGTALPFSKAQLKQEMQQLFDRGIIDRQEYFKQTDFPNWEAVEQRLTQQEQAKAEAAAAAEQAK